MNKPISFMDPEVQKCPFAAYDEVRAQGPVYIDPATGWYYITDYELARKLTADTDALSSYTGILMCKKKSEIQDRIDKIFEEEGYPQIPLLVVGDPPEHRFHRSFVDKAFLPVRVVQMEKYIEGVVDELIDQFIDKPEIDFRPSFAMAAIQIVMVDQLGMSREELPQLQRWTDAVVANQDQSLSPEKQIEYAHILCELHRYAARRTEEFRQQPRDCLLSDIVNGSVDGRQLTMNEIAILCEQVIAGSNDSTTNALCNAMVTLIEQPELQDHLREHPELIGQFVEESLRLDAPVQGLFREPKRDLEIGGVKIPKGSVVVLKWGAANRDPAQFPNPDTVDLKRPNANRHLSFGTGVHLCVGNKLARGVMRIAVDKLLRRLKNFRFARGEHSYIREPHFFAWGPTELHISFDRIV